MNFLVWGISKFTFLVIFWCGSTFKVNIRHWWGHDPVAWLVSILQGSCLAAPHTHSNKALTSDHLMWFSWTKSGGWRWLCLFLESFITWIPAAAKTTGRASTKRSKLHILPDSVWTLHLQSFVYTDGIFFLFVRLICWVEMSEDCLFICLCSLWRVGN